MWLPMLDNGAVPNEAISTGQGFMVVASKTDKLSFQSGHKY